VRRWIGENRGNEARLVFSRNWRVPPVAQRPADDAVLKNLLAVMGIGQPPGEEGRPDTHRDAGPVEHALRNPWSRAASLLEFSRAEICDMLTMPSSRASLDA
jgi:hypothetical protein